MISIDSIHSSLCKCAGVNRLVYGISMIAAIFFLAVSCSDDESQFSDNTRINGSGTISFTVNTIDSGWNSSTRSEVNSSSPSRLISLTSAATETRLYLIPEIIEGVAVGPSSGQDSPTAKASSRTRSSLTDDDNIADFGVYASLRPDGTSSTSFSADYMCNVEVTKANSWTPSVEYLWPGKASLHINAYSPFISSADSSEGITSLPASDANGNPSLSWVTPKDVAGQYDLLWATPQDASASPCDLTFNHALAAVRFVTGSEMSPCTVKEITLSDIADAGTLDIESGQWTLADSKTDYTLASAITLEAAAGSTYVAPDTPITSDDQTLLLLPQTFESGSQITLTVELNGTDYTFSASLEGQSWTAGKTMVYRLSANPASDTLILRILDSDGKQISTLKSSYTGSELSYSVKSEYQPDNSESPTQVAWKAEFIDNDGNVIERPDWITSFTTSGDGDGDCTSATEIQVPTFSSMSSETKELRAATDINATSGHTPYNLSNATGAAAVENTANTYVISAPGQYSLPLVYGNAVKDGSANEAAYVWNTHTRNVLTRFLNHLGNGITDPYIYNNSGCVPYDACIVWEGRIGTIKNLSLSADSHFIVFDVDPDFIRQGNAVVAVRDKEGNIMWSWQLWFTPHIPEDDMLTFTYNNTDYHIMARNIGQTTGGDTADFAAQSVKVRFTQVTDGSVEPKSTVITIETDAYQETTSFHYSYYQWGRKDPFNSGVNIWYGSDNSIISSTPTIPYISRPSDTPFVSSCILRPNVFWTATHDEDAEPSYEYLNLWNVRNSNTSSIKSVYDPSPAGFRVPNIEMTVFNTEGGSEYPVKTVSRYTDYPSLEYTLPGGALDFTLFGYLSSNNAAETNSESIGPIWLNSAQNARDLKEARYMPISASQSFSNSTISRSMGYGIRPIKDE